MGFEVDLLRNYPKAKRDLNERQIEKTPEVRAVARKFGEEFFDGDRKFGYGGFSYHPRFWEGVIPDLISHFGMQDGDSVLDVGCAKGFMLHDLLRLGPPNLSVRGIDISSYAVDNCIAGLSGLLDCGCASELPYSDDSFDFVLSVNTIHNLELTQCKKSIQEIERVSRKGAFIVVDAFRDESERERMFAWNLTAKTIMSTDQWIALFDSVGYTGDYYWFTP